MLLTGGSEALLLLTIGTPAHLTYRGLLERSPPPSKLLLSIVLCVLCLVERRTSDAVKVMNPGAPDGDMRMGEIEGTRSLRYSNL